jgi:hypothetical protein
MAPFCIPAAVGIPGFESPRLTWWAPGTRPLEDYPEDPNWLGSFSVGEGSGTQAQVQFRALTGLDGGSQFLYLSWVVRVQPNLPLVNVDGVSLLIGDGTNYIAVKVRLATTATTINGGKTVAYAISTHSYTVPGAGMPGTLGPPHSQAPGWATDTGRAWINYDSKISSVLPTPRIPWAFQVRVPLGVNIAPIGATSVTLPVAASFKLWHQLNVTVAAPAPGGVVAYSWPGTLFTLSELNFIPANVAPAEVALPIVGGCVAGITLSQNQIGIEDVAVGGDRATIQLDLTNTPPDVALPQHQNVLYARPSGVTAAAIPSLTATFRLANWGTTFTDTSASSWTDVPGGDQVPYKTAAPPFPAEFRFTWPKPPLDAFTQDFITGRRLYDSSGGVSGKLPHQCMFVEMFTSDGNVVLTKSSGFNNLWAINASTYHDVAEVSVVGNPPIGPGPRDVYLYLQTMGLPEVADDDYRRKMAGALGGDVKSPVASDVTFNRIPVAADLFDRVPTYQVHAYYDTGQRLQLVDGSSIKILRPQTSFGYAVSHQGSLVGWETRLYGAEKLTDNLYVVRVPNNGSVRIRTAIQARETTSEPKLPLRECHGWCCRLAAWLDTKGEIGRRLAFVVRVICGIFGQET